MHFSVLAHALIYLSFRYSNCKEFLGCNWSVFPLLVSVLFFTHSRHHNDGKDELQSESDFSVARIHKQLFESSNLYLEIQAIQERFNFNW